MSISRSNVKHKVLEHHFKRKALSRLWEVHTLSQVIAGHGGTPL